MMKTGRRGFITGMVGLGLFGAGGCITGGGVFSIGGRHPGEKLRFGVIGAGGKGFTDWTMAFKHGELPVAICDVDRREIDTSLEFLHKSGFDTSSISIYTDYRRMLDDQSKLKLDMVSVSTPDHMHAAQAISAMRQGISCYVQKPLVRTLWEARYFGKVAKESGCIVQMGNQGSAAHGHRRNVELLQQGVIGEVTEIYVWTDRPIWFQGDMAMEFSRNRPVHAPAALDWDSWLGTAASRAYPEDRPAGMKLPCRNQWAANILGVYHKFNWRAFHDFGTGAFGDMACHTLNLPFRGAELGAAVGAECQEQAEGNCVAYPSRSHVKVVYAARKSKARPGKALPAVTMHWYDGGMRPSEEKLAPIMKALGDNPQNGCVIVGTKGMMASLDAYGINCVVLMDGEKSPRSTKEHEACAESVVAPYIPRRKGTTENIGKDTNYEQVSELCEAIKGEGPVFRDTGSRCFSDVDYAVPIMEGMLVGCIAQRVPGALRWDSERQSFDSREANAMVRPYIRRGWEF